MKTGVYDTGLYSFEYPAEATAIILRRVEGGLNNRGILVNHMRVYQSPNLIQFGATIYYQTPAIAGNGAENLITNLESRSSTDMWNARTSGEWQSPEASYKSCYVTDSAKITADKNLMKVVIDLG